MGVGEGEGREASDGRNSQGRNCLLIEKMVSGERNRAWRIFTYVYSSMILTMREQGAKGILD